MKPRDSANHVVSSKDSAAIRKLAGTFDLLIFTVNVRLDWDALIGTLAERTWTLAVPGIVLADDTGSSKVGGNLTAAGGQRPGRKTSVQPTT